MDPPSAALDLKRSTLTERIAGLKTVVKPFLVGHRRVESIIPGPSTFPELAPVGCLFDLTGGPQVNGRCRDRRKGLSRETPVTGRLMRGGVAILLRRRVA